MHGHDGTINNTGRGGAIELAFPHKVRSLVVELSFKFEARKNKAFK